MKALYFCSTAVKISIEHVNIFFSTGISDRTFDMKILPDIVINPGNPHILRKVVLKSSAVLLTIL